MALLNVVLPMTPSSDPRLAFSNKENQILGRQVQKRVPSLEKGSRTLTVKCLKGLIAMPTLLNGSIPDVVDAVLPGVVKKPDVVKRKDFPRDFMFGVSTSAFQTEGDGTEGGRGPATWDAFIQDGNAPGTEIAVDSYHRYKEDVQLLKNMGADTYRLSISWSRILPRRALTTGQSIWLCNAHDADSKVFTRSLLAKSASIQTVVCFPFRAGVIELGVTELVLEDPGLIQHVKTTFLEFTKPICSEQSTSGQRSADDDEDPVCAELDREIVDNLALEELNPVIECEMQPESESQKFPFSVAPDMAKEEIIFDQDGIEELHANICEELKTGSPQDSSNGCGPNQQTEDSFMLEGINGGASQAQSWQFLDDEFSNCVHDSMNSSDSISQTFVNPEKAVLYSKGKKINNLCLHDLQEYNDTRLNSLDLGTDDMHYPRTLAAIFRNSDPLIIAPCIRDGNHKSSFASWKKGEMMDAQNSQIGTSQKMLKKILFEVAWMHGDFPLRPRQENDGKDGLWKPIGDDIGLSHVLLERRRREKLDEKFLVLKSLVPSASKVHKASVLNDTIAHLKELERRVKELESCRELMEFEARARRKHPDIIERTSDNYGSNGIANGNKPSINKRKASDIDETDPELTWDLPKDGVATEVTVSVIEKEILIEIRCPWRECLLLDIVEAVSNLHLDAHAVQSSTVDSLISLTLKSKFKGAAVASAGMIKQSLQRVVSNC